MTVTDVQERLNSIRHMGETELDDETAHMEEKDLWCQVLQHYADQPAGELAALALTSMHIEFSRWFA